MLLDSMRRNFAEQLHTGEGRFVVSVVPNLSKGLKKGFSTSRGEQVPFTRADSGAPSELGRMAWPIPGAPLRYTPGSYPARLRRLRTHISGSHENRVKRWHCVRISRGGVRNAG
jgi:hypothetical protein